MNIRNLVLELSSIESNLQAAHDLHNRNEMCSGSLNILVSNRTQEIKSLGYQAGRAKLQLNVGVTMMLTALEKWIPTSSKTFESGYTATVNH